jgi:DNA-binding NarL/FixJ family response regulator
VRIRIQLAHMPGMLREVLSEIIERERDMEVVDQHGDMDNLLDCLERSPADVLIAGFALGESSQAATAIHARTPGVRLLAIEGREHNAWLYRLQPTCTLLGRISPVQLVLAVRQAVQPMQIIRLGREGSPDAELDARPDVVVDPAPPGEKE